MPKKNSQTNKVFGTVVLVLVGIAALFGIAAMFQQSPNITQAPPVDTSVKTTDTTPSDTDVAVFFSKAKGSENITEAVSRPLPKDMEPVAVEFALEQLLKGPTPKEIAAGYFSEIPKGTKLLEVTYQPKALQVNLSKQFATGGGSNSMQQRLAELRQTVRAVEKKLPVFVLVEGQKLETLGGEGVEVPTPINQAGTGEIQ